MCGLIDCDRVNAAHVIKGLAKYTNRLDNAKEAIKMYLSGIKTQCNKCETKGDCDYEHVGNKDAQKKQSAGTA
jgi:adenosine/AMP kinase